MKELSLNVLDIAENSVRAKANHVWILLDETETELQISIRDDGCGMSEDFLARVTDPFSTTRTTRKVGLGIPFFKMEAEQTGGWFRIRSSQDPENHGTETTAFFCKNSIDYIPLGDIVETICTLIMGAPAIDFIFEHKYPGGETTLKTSEMREILGEEVPLSSPDVICWVRESLRESYSDNQYDAS
ncbi:MAG: sensor histidine kinase [Clostridia bacterium]|nr:sensor histidine kinase [Clostridia bacterium]